MNGIDDQIQSYYEEQARKAAAKARQNHSSTGSNGGSNHNGSSNNSGGSSNGGGSYTPVTPSGSGYTWPVPGHTALSSVFGEDRGTYGHGAIDISDGSIMGATVVAADSGTVVVSNNSCTHNWGKSVLVAVVVATATMYGLTMVTVNVQFTVTLQEQLLAKALMFQRVRLSVM